MGIRIEVMTRPDSLQDRGLVLPRPVRVYNIDGEVAHLNPTANAGKDWVVELPKDRETIPVMLDASRSTAGSVEIIAYDWFKEGVPLGEGKMLEIALPLGRHVIDLVVTDANGCLDVTDVIIYVHRPGFPEP